MNLGGGEGVEIWGDDPTMLGVCICRTITTLSYTLHLRRIEVTDFKNTMITVFAARESTHAHNLRGFLEARTRRARIRGPSYF